MSLNCNEINLILEELNLEGSFIQEIIQPGFDMLAFCTYNFGVAKTVVICTAQNACRMNETRKKITRNEKPLRFMEFLKSRIKGARIDSIKQIGLERIVKMDLSHAGEKYKMYIRLWNNAANVILCDENNQVLDTMFRRPTKNEVTGKYFEEPVADEAKYEKIDKWQIRPIDEEAVRNHNHSTAEKISFNEFIDFWYSEYADNLSREALLEKAEKWYTSTRTRREAALDKLIQKQKEFQNAESLKHQGDLILAYGYSIQKDSNYLECEDYETGKTVRLLINPKKSPQENAADYYKSYKKAVSGAEELIHDIEITKAQIEKLDKQYNDIINEKNPVKIEQMLRKDTTPKQQIKKTHPGLDYTVNGWYILVGRDANENDELLRHHVRGEDLWLHVRDFPGGYVFIKAKKGKTVPLDILLDAANLAVYYSKARNAGKTDLYYTHVKYLRRAKNGPKGLVLPTQEKNLCITPDKARLARLDSLHKAED